MPGWLTPILIMAAVGVVLTVGGFIWKAARWSGRVDADRENFKDNAEKDRSTMKEFMVEIRDDVKKIFQRLPPVPVAGQSPARLTEFGEQISQKIQGKAWAAKLAPSLVPEVAGMAEYQVEDFCRKYVHTRLKAADKEKVLMGMYEFGIDREDILAVLKIILRDELFKQRHARENR